MSDLRAERDSGERLRKGAGSQASALQDAYLETRAALSEVRDLYFQQVSTEAAEFLRREELERQRGALEQRMDVLDRRMQALETQFVQVTTALGQKRNIYQRIVWLLFGKR